MTLENAKSRCSRRHRTTRLPGSLRAIAPACVAPLLQHRIDLSATFARARSGGIYTTGISIKGKTPVPGFDFSKNDTFGIAIAAGAVFNLTNTATENFFVVVPVTIRMTPDLLVNLNIGHSHDQFASLSSSLWGAGFKLNLKKIDQDKFTILGEVFGNDRDPRTSAQLGIRFTPIEKIDIDLIYGYNLAGEAANWFTAGMNFRF